MRHTGLCGTFAAVPSPQIAAVMTVHNRVDLTMRCLASLQDQGGATTDLTVYLLDDGSNDGTAARVTEAFPSVVLLHGDGSFYWNGGMRVAMARARYDDPDYYLWVNDDTVLEPAALEVMLRIHARMGGPGAATIVCGAVQDPDGGEITYSGVVQDRWRPGRFELVDPSDGPRRIDTMNGNCVLISREVVSRVGNLSPAYQHGMGDFDYGMRARRSGTQLWLAPGVLGRCSANPGFVPTGRGIVADLGAFRSTKHLPPAEWAYFMRRWGGSLWPVFWVSPYVRQLMSLTRRRLGTTHRTERAPMPTD